MARHDHARCPHRAIAVAAIAHVGVMFGLAPAAVAQPVFVDGRTDDWAQGVHLAADEHFVYARLSLATEISLNGAPAPVLLAFDTDADPTTGRDGAEIEIAFSEPRREGDRRWGPRVTLYDAAGAVAASPAATEIDLHAAPTHASREFEVRFARAGVLGRVCGAPGTIRARVSFAGQPVASPTGWVACEAAAPAAPLAPADETIPAKPDGGLRVLVWNVLWGKPAENPAAFARVFEALRPDLIMFQEWDRGDSAAADIERWLDTHAAWGGAVSGEGWSVSEGEAWGVAIATPHPMVAPGPDNLRAPGTRWDFPVRLASAVIDTPLGRLAAGTVHYKCCGALGTEEDRRRLVEAEVVNDTLADLAAAHGAELVLFGGDINLNGTSAVLDISVAGLDADGSPLAWAEPRVLGHPAAYTHGTPGSGSSRSRLDFFAYADSRLAVANSFVLETSRLGERALASAGLTREDSHASDHLPVVVDVVRQQGD